jgi:hypothetical protein
MKIILQHIATDEKNNGLLSLTELANLQYLIYDFKINDTAMNVNRFGQSVCGLQTVVLRANSKAADNIRLKEILKKGVLLIPRQAQC